LTDDRVARGKPLRPLRIAIVCGLAAAALLTIAVRVIESKALMPDFDHLWFASRAMLHGQDPYRLIGPNGAFKWPWGLAYPLPTLLLLSPLALLPLEIARATFIGLSVGAFAYTIARWRPATLPILAAYPLFQAVLRGQWSPLLAAAFSLPFLGLCFAAKPTVGTAMFVARPTRLAAVTGVALTILSFLVLPSWFSEWRVGTETSVFYSLALRPGGFLILLACIRWRRPEARLLAALACVPQSTAPYEALYPLLVAETRLEAAALALLSYAGWAADLAWASGKIPYPSYLGRQAVVAIWTLYLPAVVIVLRRANVGALHPLIERLSARLPDWLRGESPVSEAGGSTQ